MPITLSPNLFIIVVLLIAMMVICVWARKLTVPASLTAGLIGLFVFAAFGETGILMLVTFFILGVLATAHKKQLKARYHPEITYSMGRNAGQVFANGGVAGLLAILALVDHHHSDLYILMVAASLASALADTLSSELGMVYGRRFYNILTFKKDANGLDGVISLEGTLIGACGACVIALIYTGFDKKSLLVIAAGIIGNITDSLLGATLERKSYLNNDMVNFLNTLVASLFGMMFYYLSK
ncbi:hypothetical protein CPT03_05895 [Pedobacter ginsengisoli]|uniref:DUF92 domain-containing protein n=1 Tax=Pedobacter ginsengisoli TaxID=363852 RepID=A0A2D1U329_9SPHI|nr:DUF92 domain-containing protein [Pedobacter ginsengisoli]ATP56022.1 hypothetical protein CPT03_05895 [Pedobacter ginsengisoli]